MAEVKLKTGDDVAGSFLPGTIHDVAMELHSAREFEHIVQGIVHAPHDDILLTYTGDDLTGVVYSYNGSVVATLTLSYDGSGNLSRILRS